MGYKLCRFCGCPVLKKGQKRRHSHDYRHARGCPYDRYSRRKNKSTKTQ